VIYHCCFDLGYILRRGGAREMAGRVRLPGAKALVTEAELLTHAALLQMRGMEAMPTCGNYDHTGHYRGHEEASS